MPTDPSSTARVRLDNTQAARVRLGNAERAAVRLAGAAVVEAGLTDDAGAFLADDAGNVLTGG